MRVTFLLLWLLSFSGHAGPEINFDQLAWLEGCWQGDGLGGEVSECWIRSDDGYYTGVFQLQQEGKLRFTEIVALANFGGSPAMRVRHFSSDFSQWESDQGSYISFPLERITLNRLIFQGLEYHFVEGRLEVRLDMKRRDGTVSVQKFSLRRTGSP